MNVGYINQRVDAALAANRRAETIIIAMSVAIFVVGLIVFAFSYWMRNPYLAGGATILNGFLYGPIREIRRIRKENVILQVVPSIVAVLPPKEAVQEIKKLLNYLRSASR